MAGPILARLLSIAVLAGPVGLAQARLVDPSIPPANPARDAELWKKEWRNPRVLVDVDATFVLVEGAPLTDESRSVDDVAAALAALPKRAWPYGRIVSLVATPRLTRSPRARESRIEAARSAIRRAGVDVIETPVGCECDDGIGSGSNGFGSVRRSATGRASST